MAHEAVVAVVEMDQVTQQLPQVEMVVVELDQVVMETPQVVVVE